MPNDGQSRSDCPLMKSDLRQPTSHCRRIVGQKPFDMTAACHSHFHAAQLLKHLLGLRKQKYTSFVLVYLWFDVPGAEAAIRHRREIESFGEVLKRDRVAFISRTYQEVFEVLRGGNAKPMSPHVAYLLERYLGEAPRRDDVLKP